MKGMRELRSLTAEQLARAEERLRNPRTGSRIEASRRFGVDLTLLMEQLRLSPAERARGMDEVAQAAGQARGAARGKRK